MAKPDKTPQTLAVGPNLDGAEIPEIPVGTDLRIDGAGFVPGEAVVLDTGHSPIELNADGNGVFVARYDYPYGANEEGAHNEIRAQVWNKKRTLETVATASFRIV